jgi:uncharacterized RDD family membrane protein YckC
MQEKENKTPVAEVVSKKLIGFANALSLTSQIERKYEKLRINKEHIPHGKTIAFERYASFSERINALLFDLIIISIITIYLLSFLKGIVPETKIPPSIIEKCKVNQAECFEEIQSHYLSSKVLMINFISFLLQIVFSGLFFVLSWISLSASIGKLIFSIKIVDAKTFEKPTKVQFIIRYFGYILSASFFMIGFISAHYNERRQGWHDKLARTVVVSKESINPNKSLKNTLKSLVLLLAALAIIYAFLVYR